jgi:hypothetical protein
MIAGEPDLTKSCDSCNVTIRNGSRSTSGYTDKVSAVFIYRHGVPGKLDAGHKMLVIGGRKHLRQCEMGPS